MRLDRTTVPLVPRTTGNCLDLAIRFFSSHIQHIGEIWLSVALPAGLLAYLLSVQLEMDVRLTLSVLYFATVPLGVLMVAGTSRALFGDSFVPASNVKGDGLSFGGLVLKVSDGMSVVLFGVLVVDHVVELLGPGLLPSEEIQFAVIGLLLLSLAVRLVLMTVRYSRSVPKMWRVLAMGFLRRLVIGIGPALMLFTQHIGLIFLGIGLSLIAVYGYVRSSFQPEAVFLAAIDRELRSRNTKDLLKSEGIDLLVRGCKILSFCYLMSLVLFITVDFGSELLLGFPILFGRLADVLPDPTDSDNFIASIFKVGSELVAFALGDPLALAAFTTVVLIAYPIGRLAWFFCYIDLRVRRDLWDLELQFQLEAQQLERRTA